MRFGFVVPSGDAADVAEMAAAAEQAGWDGLFVWEALYGVDAWVSLGAAAMRTSTIRLGTLLTPCLLYTSPSPRDRTRSRMPSSA